MADPMIPQPGRGANRDLVHRHNLAAVLGIAHRSRGASRSALTRATGLNRSTIASLVAELTDLGLVREADPQPNRRVGRPSPVVHPVADVVAIGVNPEVDAVTIGLVGLDGTVHARIRRPVDAPPSARDTAEIVGAILRGMRGRLTTKRSVVGVGVAVPGLVREADGMVRLAPHLTWTDEPFAAILRQETGLPVSVSNDAHLGAKAELLFGVGRGVSDMVYLNGGASGIGGSVITDGRDATGATGYAGEIGHTLVDSSGIRCHCGATGCLETEVSRSRLLEALAMDRADEEELEHALMTGQGEELRAELERQLEFLAIALRNVVNVLDPELIVLGGFLGSLVTATGDRLDRLVAARTMISGHTPRIARAELGSHLLIVGAAELAFAPLLDDPLAIQDAVDTSPMLG